MKITLTKLWLLIPLFLAAGCTGKSSETTEKASQLINQCAEEKNRNPLNSKCDKKLVGIEMTGKLEEQSIVYHSYFVLINLGENRFANCNFKNSETEKLKLLKRNQTIHFKGDATKMSKTGQLYSYSLENCKLVAAN